MERHASRLPPAASRLPGLCTHAQIPKRNPEPPVAPRSTGCREQETLRKPPTPRQRMQKRGRPRTAPPRKKARQLRPNSVFWGPLARGSAHSLSTRFTWSRDLHLPDSLATAVPGQGHPTGTNYYLFVQTLGVFTPQRIQVQQLPSASAFQLHAVALEGWAAERHRALTSPQSSALAPFSRCSLGPKTPATGSRCRQHGATV